MRKENHNPNGVEHYFAINVCVVNGISFQFMFNPVGVDASCNPIPRVARIRATLGFVVKPRWGLQMYQCQIKTPYLFYFECSFYAASKQRNPRRGKFSAVGIIRAELVKHFRGVGCFKRGAEGAVVGFNIVGRQCKIAEQILDMIVPREVGKKFWTRRRWKRKIKARRNTQMTAGGLIHEARAVEFAFVGMAGDVRGRKLQVSQ